MNKGHVRRRCPKPPAKACESGRCGHAYEWRFSHAARVFTGSAATERAAHAAMRKAMASAEDGQLVSKREAKAAEQAATSEAEQQVRLESYLTEWLSRRTKLRENTRFGYANVIRLHVAPTLGQVPIADLTTRQVRDLLERLAQPDGRGRVRTGATLARVRSLLSGALQDAVADGLVPTNVARGVRIPESAAPSRAVVEVFTPAQLGAFLAQADLTPFGPVVRFVAATGVRRGEAVGLAWDAVDLDAGTATIGRSLTRVGGQVRVDKPKTRKGERVVPLDRETVAILRELRRTHAEEALRSGALWNPAGYVFVRADGSHLLPDSVTQAVKRLTTAMGLPDLHLHSAQLRDRGPGRRGRREGRQRPARALDNDVDAERVPAHPGRDEGLRRRAHRGLASRFCSKRCSERRYGAVTGPNYTRVHAQNVAPAPGLEPGTVRLTVECSAN